MVIRTLRLLIFIFLLLSKIINCFVDIIIIEQFDFGRNAKKISAFEHNASKIRDIEKKYPRNSFTLI
jgi:L-cystine uptake protein TcyP (sodium:dicarboxylate symporter family)